MLTALISIVWYLTSLRDCDVTSKFSARETAKVCVTWAHIH